MWRIRRACLIAGIAAVVSACTGPRYAMPGLPAQMLQPDARWAKPVIYVRPDNGPDYIKRGSPVVLASGKIVAYDDGEALIFSPRHAVVVAGAFQHAMQTSGYLSQYVDEMREIDEQLRDAVRERERVMVEAITDTEPLIPWWGWLVIGAASGALAVSVGIPAALDGVR